MNTLPNPNHPDLVAEAVAALRDFGTDMDRTRAANLLVLWARFAELDVRQFGQVIDHFPAAKS